jgi:hypothetical protein
LVEGASDMAMEKRNKGTRLLEDNFSKRMKENCDTTEQREKTWKVIFHSYLVWPFKHSRETERKKSLATIFSTTTISLKFGETRSLPLEDEKRPVLNPADKSDILDSNLIFRRAQRSD